MRQTFLLSFYLPVEADNAYLEGDIFAALCEGSFGSHFQAAAARDFHAYQGDVVDVVLAEDFCQFFGVVDVVEFRAADEGDAALDEIFVEAGVGISRTVGRDEQAGTIEIRRMGRYELELDRPLAELVNGRP